MGGTESWGSLVGRYREQQPSTERYGASQGGPGRLLGGPEGAGEEDMGDTESWRSLGGPQQGDMR